MRTTKFDINKAISAFLIIGMAVAIILTTAIRIRSGSDRVWLLLLAAFGSLMGILSTVSSANGRIYTFLFGILDVSIYAVTCFIGQKYGNAALHLLYFLPMQFIGYVQWKRRGAAGSRPLKARRMSWKLRVWTGAALVLSSTVLFLVMRFAGAGDTPLFDAISVVCNIIGQLLMTAAYAEQWLLWIGVNISTIAMWSMTLAANPGDSYAVIYVIKYSFYLANAINGLRLWIGLSREG